MPLPAGTRLGPYEILAPIGAGGMGEVYRAKDARLNRTVAIKVLPARLADNAEARQRFEREARAVSSLNHPHVCVLHDIGHHEGIDFLVMEYLEGETLAARLSKGPLALEQALQYAVQIAGALAAAHRRGISHRDLKPGNVILTKSGAKLLDFGLAKLHAPGADHTGAGASSLSTVAQGLTDTGTIVGTFQYMAPEQLEGKETDARADIFSFGAVLYEMLTGRKAFEGQNQASVIGAILHVNPPSLSALQPLAPPALDRLMNACLAKDPDERWQTAHDLRLELQWIETGPSNARARGPVPNKRERVWWVGTTVFLLAVAVAAWIASSNRSDVEAPLRFSVSSPRGESLLFATNQGGSAISPDGLILAFAATSQGKPMLWLRRLDALVARPIVGTEGGYYPFWSPDSRSVGFFAGGKLKKIEIQGGLPQTLCDAPEGRGGTWNRNDVIVFTPVVGPAYRISAAGGTPAPLTKLDAARKEDAHYWPYFLPDGRHFLYLARNQQRENDAIFAGSLDAGPETQRPIRLVTANSNAAYVPPRNGHAGYLLFGLDQTLTARQFNTTRLEMAGESIAIAAEVGYLSILRLGNFSVSATGILAYGGKRGLAQMAWIGRDGKALSALGAPGNFEFFSLSPDDKRVATDTHDPDGYIRMWIVDARGANSRLNLERKFALTARWSPDGQQIAFAATIDFGDVNSNIYRQPASGTQPTAERLTTSKNPQLLDDWSSDGGFLVYSELDPKTRNDLWVLPLTGERKPVPFLVTQFDEKEGRFAPTRTGPPRWLAYTSDETGPDEVYVQSFQAPGTRVRISTNGGSQPRWRRDGKELFYLAPDGSIMGVPISMTPSGLQAEAPAELCRPSFAEPLTPHASGRFEASADGRRFLILAPSGGPAAQGIDLAVNWDAVLKR